MTPPCLKRCGKCGQAKPRYHFGRSRKAKDGLRVWCRACDLVYQATYRAGLRGLRRLT